MNLKLTSFSQPLTMTALAVSLSAAIITGCSSSSGTNSNLPPATAAAPATPIKHLVVIFQENVSFDHYFGTYPNAQNNAGEQPFTA